MLKRTKAAESKVDALAAALERCKLHLITLYGEKAFASDDLCCTVRDALAKVGR